MVQRGPFPPQQMVPGALARQAQAQGQAQGQMQGQMQTIPGQPTALQAPQAPQAPQALQVGGALFPQMAAQVPPGPHAQAYHYASHPTTTAYQQTYTAGGYPGQQGYPQGYTQSYPQGYLQGYPQGVQPGYPQGYPQGRVQARPTAQHRQGAYQGYAMQPDGQPGQAGQLGQPVPQPGIPLPQQLGQAAVAPPRQPAPQLQQLPQQPQQPPRPPDQTALLPNQPSWAKAVDGMLLGKRLTDLVREAMALPWSKYRDPGVQEAIQALLPPELAGDAQSVLFEACIRHGPYHLVFYKLLSFFVDPKPQPLPQLEAEIAAVVETYQQACRALADGAPQAVLDIIRPLGDSFCSIAQAGALLAQIQERGLATTPGVTAVADEYRRYICLIAEKAYSVSYQLREVLAQLEQGAAPQLAERRQALDVALNAALSAFPQPSIMTLALQPAPQQVARDVLTKVFVSVAINRLPFPERVGP